MADGDHHKRARPRRGADIGNPSRPVRNMARLPAIPGIGDLASCVRFSMR